MFSLLEFIWQKDFVRNITCSCLVLLRTNLTWDKSSEGKLSLREKLMMLAVLQVLLLTKQAENTGKSAIPCFPLSFEPNEW